MFILKVIILGNWKWYIWINLVDDFVNKILKEIV